MQCKEFEVVVAQEGLAPLPLDARSHLAGCSTCQAFLADFSTIASLAKELPAEVEPPQRVWVSLLSQLESEGIVRESKERAAVAQSAPWWAGLSALLRPRYLATAGLGFALVAAASFTFLHKPVSIAHPAPPPVTAQIHPSVQPAVAAPEPVAAQAELAASTQPKKPRLATPATLKPSPSDSLYTSTAVALRDAEIDADGPSLRGNVEVDAALRKNLRALNDFISDCEKRLKQYPNDSLTREYLASAYQQKAELLAAMLDNGRSEQ